MRNLFIVFLLFAFSSQLFAQAKRTANNQPPALAAIKEVDLKKDIFELAGDGFRGRRAGTPDELRAAVWVAQKAQEAGLKPAGDDGTYFQYYNIKRIRINVKSTLELNGRPLMLSKQFWLTQPVESHLDAPVTWLTSMADTAMDLQGKVVALNLIPPTPLPASWISLYGYRYTASALRQQGAALRRKHVAAIIFVANDVADAEATLAFTGHNFEEGIYQLDVPATPAAAAIEATRLKATPVFFVRADYAHALQQQGAHVKADVKSDSFLYPSVNVIAKAAGTDAKLKNEYVLFSGHHDHDGVGNPIAGDSIWNGADDNASVTVGMLAIGRAWAARPGKRSALFVWHGAEERGLLGSKWYAAHPTVDKQAIVAVLNGDMIGRNSPDSAALLGSLAPHKNSTALVDMAMQANAELTHFKVDFSWDDAKHPEGWYFRSDHVPYAQAGIPAVFFTTLLHPDYHTPRDEPQRIDIAKLAKMSKWMYATGWLVSQTDVRPALDTK